MRKENFNSRSASKAKYGKGQALVEFALIIPLVLVLVMASIEFGVLINNHVSVNNAAREGARAAALGRPINEVKARIIASSGLLLITSSEITAQKSGDNGQAWSALGPESGGTSGSSGSGGSSPTYNDANAGELVRVSITIGHKQLTNFIPGMNNLTITKNVVMRREQT